MNFFARMSPLRAFRDLRLFLAARKKYEIYFLLASIGLTASTLWAFAQDSHVEKVYKPDIVYVQQWKLDRTDAEIVAQQKVDQVKKDAELAELKKRQAETQASFKRLDDKLSRMGL